MKVLSFGQSGAAKKKQQVKKLQEEHQQIFNKLKAKHARHMERNKADYERMIKLELMINDALLGPV